MAFRTFSGSKNQRAASSPSLSAHVPLANYATAAYATAKCEHHCPIVRYRIARPVASTHIAPMHQRALLLSLTASSAAAFVTPASVAIGTPSHALTRRWADDLDGAGVDDDAAAAPSLDAVETAVLNDALDTAAKQTAPKRKKKRPVDPERAPEAPGEDRL